MVNIGNRIKTARQKKGMSQEELAQAIGATKAAVSRYEAGKRRPSYDQLQRIAAALGTSISNLLPPDNYWEDENGVGHTEPQVVEHEGPLQRAEVVERSATPEELEALLAKLQDGEPLVLSPEELAKLKATPKEQVAAALDKKERGKIKQVKAPVFKMDAIAPPGQEVRFSRKFPVSDDAKSSDVHLRYEHSLGVTHIAKDMLEQISVPSTPTFLWDNMRYCRNFLGLTQKALAEKTGIPVKTIREYEDGNSGRFISEGNLQKIAAALGVPAKKLLGHSVTYEWMERTYFQNAPPKERIAAALDKLNEKGQGVAAERVEELTAIPEYQAQEPPTDGPQDTPAPQEGTDTTPPSDTSQEPPEGHIQAITMICPICGQHLRGNTETGKAYCNYCKRSFPLPQILK